MQETLTPWPAGQPLQAPDAAKSFLETQFADHAAYGPALAQALCQLAAEPRFAGQYGRHMGGVKLYHRDCPSLPGWDFLNARALAFYRYATQRQDGVIELAWANLYKAGDYIVPHSHTRADFSLVYCLDPGETGEGLSGRFCFADPRLALCCQAEQGRLSNSIGPVMTAGSMLLFPSHLVHFVHPYDGARTRITLSWNLTRQPLGQA
ncbi:MAG: putative 2OG-Fe(II) oxygenase [Pseudomonadota bacterium]